MDANILGLLKKQIGLEKTALNTIVVEGSAKDYSEYRWICGRIYGLNTAEYLVENLLEKLKDPED